jgi:phage repressor protein C with HTH and peptisase S24 domain
MTAGKHSLRIQASHSYLESRKSFLHKRKMSERLGKTLRAAREKRGLTQADLGRQVGVSRAAIGQWEAGDTEPSTQHLISVCSVLGISVADATAGVVKLQPLTGGAAVGDRRPETGDAEDDAVRPASAISGMRDLPKDVPVYGVAAGGADADFHTNGEVIDYVRRPPGIANVRKAYAVYVVGDSMSPRYEEGELVYVNPTRPPSIGDYILIELHAENGHRAGRGYIKKLKSRTGSRIICEQFNPKRDIEFETNTIKLMHRVIPWGELLGV